MSNIPLPFELQNWNVQLVEGSEKVKEVINPYLAS